MKIAVAAAFSCLCWLLVHEAADADTLAAIRADQTLTCGVVTDEDDFSKEDTHGNLAAFGADLCRAVAAATLAPEHKVLVRGFGDEPTALHALQSAAVAMVGVATPSVQSRTAFHLGFAPSLIFEGQGFLVANESRIVSLQGLAGKQICFIAGTPQEANTAFVFKQRGIRYLPFPFEEIGEMEAAMVTGHCAAITADISQLANMRAAFLSKTKDFMLLPETISLDPAAPAYRDDDLGWGRIVDATIEALIEAEESGITQANAEAMKASDDPAIRRLLGVTGGPGQELGIDQDWAYRAIRAVGNIGEIYERDVGARSPLKLPRDKSKLWSAGGLLYAAPVR